MSKSGAADAAGSRDCCILKIRFGRRGFQKKISTYIPEYGNMMGMRQCDDNVIYSPQRSSDKRPVGILETDARCFLLVLREVV